MYNHSVSRLANLTSIVFLLWYRIYFHNNQYISCWSFNYVEIFRQKIVFFCLYLFFGVLATEEVSAIRNDTHQQLHNEEGSKAILNPRLNIVPFSRSVVAVFLGMGKPSHLENKNP